MSYPASSTEHTFGGAWTELKLAAVSDYCAYFNKVLVGQPRLDRPFQRWYLDAFAGSGSRAASVLAGGLLDGTPLREDIVDMVGSALKALDVSPGFDRLLFVEGHHGRFRSLESIAAHHPERRITCIHGDANEELKRIFRAPPWSLQRGGRGACRGLCFLDPYGMSVDWSTLASLAETRAVDVWYLFPIGAVNRQLAGSLERVDEHKQLRLDEVFGTENWRTELYKVEATRDLFAERLTSSKSLDRGQLERYAQQRLRSLFAYVSDPLHLLNDAGMQIFSLFCLSNSESAAAIKLIQKGVTWVLKKHGPQASRRRSAR